MNALLLRLFSKGQGSIVLIIVGICIYGAFTLQPSSNFALGIGFLVSAPACWIVGIWLSKYSKVFEKNELGEKMAIPQREHAFLWIPMQWWPLPLCVISAWMIIAEPIEFTAGKVKSLPEPLTSQPTPVSDSKTSKWKLRTVAGISLECPFSIDLDPEIIKNDLKAMYETSEAYSGSNTDGAVSVVLFKYVLKSTRPNGSGGLQGRFRSLHSQFLLR